ncbi:hypothetical protein Tco_0447409, partial [Tanacetum coccineum]
MVVMGGDENVIGGVGCSGWIGGGEDVSCGGGCVGVDVIGGGVDVIGGVGICT